MTPPRSVVVEANRLRQHLLDWDGDGPPVLLLHGFLEHAHAWDFVAPGLSAAGFHVLALDWRGHGDSDRVGAGGYYHFPDYAADLSFLIRSLGGRAAIVAHSMGATAAMHYAGVEPDAVTALVCVDGLGPPDMTDVEPIPSRHAAWLADLRKVAARPRKTFTLAEAEARLRERFPRFSDAVVAHMALHGSREMGDGVRAWKFDPLHQSRAPVPFQRHLGMQLWRNVRCPVLFLEGAESVLRLSDEETAERLTALRAHRRAVPGAGHHPHLEQPKATTEALVDFLKGALLTTRD